MNIDEAVEIVTLHLKGNEEASEALTVLTNYVKKHESPSRAQRYAIRTILAKKNITFTELMMDLELPNEPRTIDEISKTEASAIIKKHIGKK